jgi:hypothetical protein
MVPPPGHREGEKQCVEPRVVEALADVLAGRENDAGRIRGDGRQLVRDSAALLLSEASPQGDDVFDLSGQSSFERIQMFVVLREDQRRASRLHGLEHVIANPLIAGVVSDQFTVEALELHPLVRGARRAR